jgi:hypothetical protein
VTLFLLNEKKKMYFILSGTECTKKKTGDQLLQTGFSIGDCDFGVTNISSSGNCYFIIMPPSVSVLGGAIGGIHPYF